MWNTLKNEFTLVVILYLRVNDMFSLWENGDSVVLAIIYSNASMIYIQRNVKIETYYTLTTWKYEITMHTRWTKITNVVCRTLEKVEKI